MDGTSSGVIHCDDTQSLHDWVQCVSHNTTLLNNQSVSYHSNTALLNNQSVSYPATQHSLITTLSYHSNTTLLNNQSVSYHSNTTLLNSQSVSYPSNKALHNNQYSLQHHALFVGCLISCILIVT